MKWFKHMSDASEDPKLMAMREKFGHAGLSSYWLILEYCSRQWKGGELPEFVLSSIHCQNILRMKSKQTDLVMTLFSELNLFQISKTENGYLIKCPKLASIKDEHTTRMAKNRESDGSKSGPERELELEEELKKDLEEKKKANTEKKSKTSAAPKAAFPVLEFYDYGEESIKQLISKVDPVLQTNWPKMYPDRDFIRITLFKIINWCNANPQKTHSRKRWGVFISTWLDKDWQQNIRNIPTNKPGKVHSLTAADLPD